MEAVVNDDEVAPLSPPVAAEMTTPQPQSPAEATKTSVAHDSSPSATTHSDDVGEEELLGYLQRLGTDTMAHSNRNLMTHLRGVHSLLKDWGNTSAVCLAGLFHSIYGTTFFTQTAVQLTQRQEIRDRIGVEAENLVYLFCACDRPHLVSQMTVNLDALQQQQQQNKRQPVVINDTRELLDRKFSLADRFEQTVVTLSYETYSQLMEIVVANWVEQFYNPKRKKTNKKNKTGETIPSMAAAKTLEKSMRTWSNAKHFLSGKACFALQTLFEDSNNEILQLKREEEQQAALKKEAKTRPKPKPKGHELIGRRVKVHWEDDECEHYKGVIAQYDQEKDLYLIHYDDGDEEWEERCDFTLLVAKNNNNKDNLQSISEEKNKKFYAQPVPLIKDTVRLRQPPDSNAQKIASSSKQADNIPSGSDYSRKGESMMQLRSLSDYPKQGPNHVVRLLSCAILGWTTAVYCFYTWDYHSLLGSMFHSSLYVSPTIVALYFAFYQILKTRTLAIALPGKGDSPVVISVNYFESPKQLQRRFWKLFPSIDGQNIVGICEENSAAVERSIIPLSMISYYALDCYNQITYELVIEKEECDLPEIPKSYAIHNILSPEQMKEFEPSVDTESHYPSEEERQKARAQFCEELRRRGYALIKVPRTFHYWKEVQAAIGSSNDWFYSHTQKEKLRCCYKSVNKNVLLGYKKEHGREFVEIRVAGKGVEKKMKWWPPNKKPQQIDGENVDRKLVRHAYEVFSLQQNLAVDMLEILTEGMGIEKHTLSQYLERYPVNENSVSACMYRLYRYNTNIGAWWKKLPIVEQFFKSPPHADLGLVTIGPRSAMPGLQAVDMVVKDKGGRGKWIDVEKFMAEDDVAVFVGNTMGHVSNGYYRPMLHKVSRPTNKDRFSLPFFLRFPDTAVVPNVVNPKRLTVVKNINRGTGARRSQLGWRNPVMRFLKAKKWIKTQTTFDAH